MTPAVEQAARRFAAAMGGASSWVADVTAQRKDPWDDGAETVAGPDALRVTRQTYTLERADRPSGLREFLCWKTTPDAVVIPVQRMDTDALSALSFARLSGPLAPIFRLYALGETEHWPLIRSYALAQIPDPMAIDEAMVRLLWPDCVDDKAARAKVLCLRKATYIARLAPVETLYRTWLELAARRFLKALGEPPERNFTD